MPFICVPRGSSIAEPASCVVTPTYSTFPNPYTSPITVSGTAAPDHRSYKVTTTVSAEHDGAGDHRDGRADRNAHRRARAGDVLVLRRRHFPDHQLSHLFTGNCARARRASAAARAQRRASRPARRARRAAAARSTATEARCARSASSTAASGRAPASASTTRGAAGRARRRPPRRRAMSVAERPASRSPIAAAASEAETKHSYIPSPETGSISPAASPTSSDRSATMVVPGGRIGRR